MSMSFRPDTVFISYKREDAPIAERVYEALVKEGFNVWWDEHLQCGQTWAEKLDEAVRDAACIVVLWSQGSVASQWVRHEASQAIARQVYAPCRIDLVQLDSPYDRIQATDLIKWNGDRSHGGFRNLIKRINTLIPPQLSLPRRMVSWIGTNLAMLAASGIALFALVLLVVITLEQRADRREKIYDCSVGPGLRAKLALETYSRDEGLERVCLRDADLSKVDLSGADLSGADLSGADLSGADLREVFLTKTDLSGASLGWADLRQAMLGGANLGGAFLREANLALASLQHADFRGANVSRADFSGADLIEANLSRADLGEATLDGADVRGANLCGALLHNADLSGSINLMQGQLEYACGNENTRLPEGLTIATSCPDDKWCQK